MTALLYNVDNMYKCPVVCCSHLRITIQLSQALSFPHSLRVFQYTQKALYWIYSLIAQRRPKPFVPYIYIANRTGTTGPSSRLPRPPRTTARHVEEHHRDVVPHATGVWRVLQLHCLVYPILSRTSHLLFP